MSLNIHPIFVHFPIALLMVYSVMEILRFKLVEKIILNQAFFYVKASFVIIGALMSYPTLVTGFIARKIVGGEGNLLISTHAIFALATVFIFSILAVGYTVSWLKKLNLNVWPWLSRIQVFIVETNFVLLLAVLGALALFITGALGGAIVYGPTADPASNFIYNLLID